MKKIIVSVTNDLTGDQRVDRVCQTLTGMGFQVLLVGRRLPGSAALPTRAYITRRMFLLFTKGPLFYAEYNLRLFLLLLFSSFDLLLANDLDTLPANRLAAFLKRKPLVYDSHEYFTEVPELAGRPGIRRIWEWIERRLLPGVDQAYTVSQSIAEVYTARYRVPFRVVRNLPVAIHPVDISGTPEDVQPLTIIYQGALNLGRGLEQAIAAMQYLPEARLILAGSGDLEEKLRKKAAGLNLPNLLFTGKLPPEELRKVTQKAHLGISIEEDLGLNYRYALPNKLFDYIQARIPVVVSNLPEMSAIVKEYDIGFIVPSRDPVLLAATFRQALTDEDLRKKWSVHLENAARELTWEKEEHKIRQIFAEYQ